MSNWLKKLFGGKECCCHEGDECCQDNKEENKEDGQEIKSEVKSENSPVANENLATEDQIKNPQVETEKITHDHLAEETSNHSSTEEINVEENESDNKTE